jgi:hypothetical protein
MNRERHITSALSFLGSFQSATYRRYGLEPIKYDKDWLAEQETRMHSLAGDGSSVKQISEAFIQQLDRIRQLVEILPTPYVNPFHNSIILRLKALSEHATAIVLREDFQQRYHRLVMNPIITPSDEPIFHISDNTFILSTAIGKIRAF